MAVARDVARLITRGVAHGPADSLGLPSWAVASDMWRDFVDGNGNMPDPTDTHAATIYAPNAAGLYLPFAANVLTRTDLGLQTVPTRTQLFASPVDFTNASWSKTRTTITADATVAPDGTLTADKLVEDTSTNTHNVAQLETLASGQQVFSISLKANERFIAIVAMSDATTGDAARRINLLTGAIDDPGLSAGSWTGISMTATQEADGFWRCQLVATRGAGTLTGARVEVCDASGNRSYTGDGTSGIFVWAGNFFAAPFAGPPILSEATVNGNQQVISGLGTQLATGVAGLMQINTLQVGGASLRLLSIDDGTSSNRIQVLYNAASIGFLVTTGGVAQASLTLSGAPTAQRYTVAYCVANNYAMARVVGEAAPTEDTVVSYPVVDRLVPAGISATTNSNVYSFTRKIALDFLIPSDDPATKFAEWYAKAQLAAAA